MRILICTNSLGAIGGIEKVTIVKANSFSEIPGNEVAICYTDRGTYPEQTMVDISEKIQIYELGVTFWDLHPLNAKNILITAPRKLIALRRELKRVIIDFRPDVMITTGSYEKFGVATINPSRLLGKPAIKVREFHFSSQYRRFTDNNKRGMLAEWFEVSILRHMFDMNYVLTREDLETNFAGKSKMDYQYNPCFLESTIDNNEIERTNTVIMLCRLEEQKNIPAMLRIWSQIIKSPEAQGWNLLIVGDGSLRSELERMATELGIMSRTTFAGYHKDVDKLLSTAKIIVGTSKNEGFALNILEGMNKGVIPISYRTPYGPTDLISDGINGILVDYNDEQQFIEKLLSLIKTPQFLDEMRPNAIEKVREFSPEKIVNDWMAKYRALLDKKR